MKVKTGFFQVLLVAATIAVPSLSLAVGRLISAPQRVDMVYDDFRGLVYITQGSQVLRYDLENESFLPPFNLVGGNLRGIDISDEGTTLAVADAGFPGIHTIDLETSQIRKISYGESLGPPSVAFAGDGSILIATGEQWGSMRRYIPKTNTMQTLFGSMRHRSMLCSSPDGSVVAFAEGDISSGQWGRYRTSDGNVLRMTGYTNGTSWFNYEIGVNFDATQYAIPTYGGCFIYNGELGKIATIGAYASGQPIGVAYHPTEDLVYFPWAGTNSIHIFNTQSLLKVGEYDFQNSFNHNGNSPYIEGRVKMSLDGKILFCSVDGGVRYFRISQAPVAQGKHLTVAEDSAVSLTLTATDDETATLTYSIVAAPTKGQLSGTAPNVIYTPNANFFGSDSFTFKANDGMQDSVTTTVAITVTNVPDAPVASSMNLSMQEDRTLSVNLSGNDADGDILNYLVTMGPANGTLSGTGKNRLYTPAANYFGTDSFLYKVSDGVLDSEVVTVQITVTPVADAPVAQTQNISTSEDTPLSITLTATDAEDNPLTYKMITNPIHGKLSGTAPHLNYTPSANFNGNDSFSFRANDGQLDSAPATIHITILPEPDAPIATPASKTLDEDTTISVILHGIDPENDAITYQVTVPPSHGLLSGDGPNYVYTPALNYFGTDSFKFVALDSELTSDEAEVVLQINPVNDAPTVANQQITIAQGQPVQFSIAAHDIENDSLQYLLTGIPAYGMLSGTLPEITFTPSKKFTGYQIVEYRVEDGESSASGQVEILVLPKNKGLVAFSNALLTDINEPVATALGGWTSLDEPMEYVVLKHPKHGHLSGLIPDLVYTPEPGFTGLDKFSYRIVCGSLRSKTVTVRIMVGTGKVK